MPTLFDSDNGEPIVALKDPFTLKYNDHLDMLNRSLSALDFIKDYDYYLPVPKSYPSAKLKGVYVPRYRQHTVLVAAGYAENKSRLDNYIQILDKAYESDDSYDSLSASN